MLIKHCFLTRKNTVQTKQCLNKCYGKSSSRKMIKKWIGEFQRDRTSTNDAERSGRPKDVTTPEIIEKNPWHRIRWFKSESAWVRWGRRHINPPQSVVQILHEYLGMKKLPAKCVPRILTIDQKCQRVRDFKICWTFSTVIQAIACAD